MKDSQTIITKGYGKKIIGKDGGQLLFIDSIPSQENKVIAVERVELHFSTVGRRAKKSIAKLFKGLHADIHIWFWAAASSPEKPEFIRDQCHEGLEKADPSLYYFLKKGAEDSLKESGEDREPFDSEIHKQLLEVAGERLVESCQRGTLTQYGELVSHITQNYRESSYAEKELIRVIGEVATRKWRVPFQKEVREEWSALQAGRNDDVFRRTRDAIGFSWLPAGTRGTQQF